MLVARGRELHESYAAFIAANNYGLDSPFRVVLGGRDATSSAHRAFLSLSVLQKFFLSAKLLAADFGLASCTVESLVASYPPLRKSMVEEEALYLYNSIVRLRHQMGLSQWRRKPVLVIAPQSYLTKLGFCSFDGGRAPVNG